MAAMVKKPEKGTEGPAAVNKKAYHDYEFVEKYEAGLSLQGSEVKSLRAAPADLTGSYARMHEGECWLVGAKIAPYQQAGNRNHDPSRKRKLLLHKAELHRIWTKLEQRGFTLVPVRLYFTSREWPRSSWPWPRASGSTTSERPSPSGPRNAISTGA